MIKGLRYIGESNGVSQFEEYIIEQDISNTLNYNQIIIELLRVKYSLDDELALNSKSMSIFLNTCTQEEKIRWAEQLKEFTAYRIECIRRAKEMCNMI